jgi:hypothetical protein
LRPGAGGSLLPSLGRKLSTLAQASIRSPLPRNGRPTAAPLIGSSFSTAAVNFLAMSPSIRHSQHSAPSPRARRGGSKSSYLIARSPIGCGTAQSH